MSVVKVIELLAQSPDSWEDATRQAIARASKSIRNIRSVYVKEHEAVVEAGEITAFRVNCKISFVLEDDDDADDDDELGGAEGMGLPRGEG